MMDDFDERRLAVSRPIPIEDTAYFIDYMDRYYIFEALYGGHVAQDCQALSDSCRLHLSYTSSTLAYGEIIYESFGKFMLSLFEYNEIKMNKMHSFVDIGSGSGKAVHCARLLDIFDRCTGIEILPDLCMLSITAAKLYYKLMGIKMEDLDEDELTVRFMHGDATRMDIWRAADIVFAHCSCFDQDMMRRLAATASRMREGSVVITLSHKLPHDGYFNLVASKSLQVTWGVASAFIYRRNNSKLPQLMTDLRYRLSEVLSRPLPDLL